MSGFFEFYIFVLIPRGYDKFILGKQDSSGSGSLGGWVAQGISGAIPILGHVSPGGDTGGGVSAPEMGINPRLRDRKSEVAPVMSWR